MNTVTPPNLTIPKQSAANGSKLAFLIVLIAALTAFLVSYIMLNAEKLFKRNTPKIIPKTPKKAVETAFQEIEDNSEDDDDYEIVDLDANVPPLTTEKVQNFTGFTSIISKDDTKYINQTTSND